MEKTQHVQILHPNERFTLKKGADIARFSDLIEEIAATPSTSPEKKAVLFLELEEMIEVPPGLSPKLFCIKLAFTIGTATTETVPPRLEEAEEEEDASSLRATCVTINGKVYRVCVYGTEPDTSGPVSAEAEEPSKEGRAEGTGTADTGSSSTVIGDERDRIIQALAEAKAENRFCDLHAHLLGMGDADFWMGLLEEYAKLPHHLLAKHMLVWHEGNYKEWSDFTFVNLPEEKKGGISDYDDITHELVFSTSSLYRALEAKPVADDLPKKCPEEDRVDQRLDIKQRGITFRDYFVWDARKQAVCKRRGVKASELWKLVTESPQIKQLLRSCFAMLDPNGRRPTPEFCSAMYHDQFSYQFYPARYALKDDIARYFNSTARCFSSSEGINCLVTQGRVASPALIESSA